MTSADVPAVVVLQKASFPPPFSEDLHWDPEHLYHHLEAFPEGQFVAAIDNVVVGSCSNCILTEHRWAKHGSWGATAGGPYIRNHDPRGTTLYGLDIGVDPDHRKMGIGRSFYAQRFALVKALRLKRFGTACRVPDYRSYLEKHPEVTVRQYVQEVVPGRATDRTLTPLLRYGLTYLDVIQNYMPDWESADSAALLEWKP